MIITYEDEYGNIVFECESAFVPTTGDTIAFGEEDFRVKSRTVFPSENSITIIVTQSLTRSVQTESVDNPKTRELERAVNSLGKRIDAGDKKSRALNEQISTVRKHVNQRIQQDKKDADNR